MWPALAMVGSAALSYLGQQDTNSANAAQAQQAENFSAEQYAHRYQTTMADMSAAGLNPILAANGGSVSGQPSGIAAQMGNPMGAAVNSGQAAYQIATQAENTRAQTQSTLKDLDVKDAQVKKIMADTVASISSATNLDQQTKESIERSLGYAITRSEGEARIQLAGAQAANQGAQARSTTEDYIRKMGWNNAAGGTNQTADYDLTQALIKEHGARTGLLGAESRNIGLGFNEAKAYSDFYGSGVGRSKPYADMGEDAINSAASLFRGGRYSAARGIRDSFRSAE